MFLWTRRWQFLRANRIVSQSRIFEAQNLKTSVKSFFLEKSWFILGLFRWARGMQFWKTCRKFLQKPKIFRSNSEIKKTKIKQHDFSKFILSGEKIPDTKFACLWALPKRNSLKVWKIVRRKRVGEIINTEVVHVERKFGILAESFCRNCHGSTQ